MKLHFLVNKVPAWPKAKLEEECTEEELNTANTRTMGPCEVVLDFESQADYDNAVKLLEPYSYQAYRTGSRGYHIHLYFVELGKFPKEQRNAIRKKFIKMFGADEQKASEDTFIAMECRPHFKTGVKKELVAAHRGEKHVLPPGVAIWNAMESQQGKQLPSDSDGSERWKRAAAVDVDVEELVQALLPFWCRGNRHKLCLSITGMCIKSGQPLEVAEQIVGRLCELTGDEETYQRLANVRWQYREVAAGRKKPEELLAFSGLREVIKDGN